MTDETPFRFELDPDEKDYLKSLARKAIAARLDRQPLTPPAPPTHRLEEHFGAFVTITIADNLRGCIGHIVGDKPLYLTIAEMAQQAAFGDPRFPQLTQEEFERIHIEISILSPITLCPDLNLIEPGRHGLLVRRGHNQGLLLPQVATDWGWSRQQFLSQTCRKAGMDGNCYNYPDTQVYWFEAEVF